MVAEEMIKSPSITLTANTALSEAAKAMMKAGITTAAVTGSRGEFLGLLNEEAYLTVAAEGVSPEALEVSQCMIPAAEVAVIDPLTPVEDVLRMLAEEGMQQLPVVSDGVFVGTVTQGAAIGHLLQRDAELEQLLMREQRASLIIQSLHEGLVVVDSDLVIREFNKAAEELAGATASERIGQKANEVSRDRSPIHRVFNTGEPMINVESELKDGRVFNANYVPVQDNGDTVAVIQTFRDITYQKRLTDLLARAREELDKAFALTLPNTRVEHKLKNTPEYRDEFNPETGNIRITSRINDGCYHHVVNALKVAADLNEKGLMNLLGIDKDILVDAIIFHDLGKCQPHLEPGQVVDPREVFENGRLHAERSAVLANRFYQRDPDVITLIRYHHHEECELPTDFPAHLLPMLRAFQLIDGLSACLTRRQGRLELAVDMMGVTVVERNNHPGYNRKLKVNLLTGKSEVVETYPALTVSDEPVIDL